MRYVSIDIETLGLDADHHDIVEFGAVLDDLSVQDPVDVLPSFHAYILPPRDEGYRGEPYAMSMHPTILRRIATRENDEHEVGRGGWKYLRPDQLVHEFAAWAKKQGLSTYKPVTKPGVYAVRAESIKDIKFVAAGKNFAGFDQRFLLAQIPGWKDIRAAHRVLDPGMLYFDPTKDKVPPSLGKCLKRAGVAETEVAHTAIDDAISVIQVLRAKYPTELFNAPA